MAGKVPRSRRLPVQDDDPSTTGGDSATNDEGTTGASDATNDERERAAQELLDATDSPLPTRDRQIGFDVATSGTTDDTTPGTSVRDAFEGRSQPPTSHQDPVSAFGDWIRSPDRAATEQAFDRPGLGATGLLGASAPTAPTGAGMISDGITAAGMTPGSFVRTNDDGEIVGGGLSGQELDDLRSGVVTGPIVRTLEEGVNSYTGRVDAITDDLSPTPGTDGGTTDGGSAGTDAAQETHVTGSDGTTVFRDADGNVTAVRKADGTYTTVERTEAGTTYTTTTPDGEREEVEHEHGGVSQPTPDDGLVTSPDQPSLRQFLDGFDGGDAPRGSSGNPVRAEATNPSPDGPVGRVTDVPIERYDAVTWVGQPVPDDLDAALPPADSFGAGHLPDRTEVSNPSPEAVQDPTTTGPYTDMPDATVPEGDLGHLAPTAGTDVAEPVYFDPGDLERLPVEEVELAVAWPAEDTSDE